jgi:coproporphyrinogen III oxidase-like Fe-S oxidoreductase
VNLREIVANFGEQALENVQPAIEELVAEDLLQRGPNSICLTARGRLLSNEVFRVFLAPICATDRR